MNPRSALRQVGLFFLLAAALTGEGCRTWSSSEELAADAYNRANLLREKGLYPEAIENYRLALDENPDFYAASFNLALALVQSGEFAEGEAVLENLILLDPGNGMILRALAWAAERSGSLETALVRYNTAIDEFNRDLEALQGRANLLDSMGRHDEASEDRRVLVELDGSTENRLNLAGSLQQAGHPDLALQEYREILVTDPENRSALTGAALTAENSGLYGEALSYRRLAAEVSGDDGGEQWWHIARLLLTEFGSYAREPMLFKRLWTPDTGIPRLSRNS